MSYDISYNSTFFARLKNWAKASQDLRREGAALRDIWNGEGVSGSGAFVGVDGITTGEATSLVVMFEDYRKFIENEAVATGDRNSVITPFLG